MADIQKQNISVTPGSLHIEMSGGFVTAISGHPIAGGSGGGIQTEKYYGDNINVQIDYDSNTISLTPNTTALIYRDIPTKVSDLTDSASYPKKTYVDETFATKTELETVSGNIVEKIPTSASQLKNDVPFITLDDVTPYLMLKQDKLTFGYDSNDKISAINGSALAGEGGGTTYQAGTDLKIDNNVISVDTNGNPHNDTEKNRNFVEGSWTEASGYNSHAEGMATTAYGYAVHAQGMWTKFSSNKWSDEQHETPVDIYWAPGAGATVEGYCNATTSCPMSGTQGGNDYGPVHGGVLKVIGNGNVVHNLEPDPDAHEHTLEPSDALIIFKDGTISAFGDIYKNDKKFITEGNFAQGNAYAMTTTGWEAIQAGGQGIQQVLHDDTLDGDGAASTSLLRVDTTKIQPVSGMTAYLTTAQYNTDSATFLTSIPNTYLQNTNIGLDSNSKVTSISGKELIITAHQSLEGYVTSATITQASTNYVMTTTGWSILTLPGGGLTGVTTDNTLTGNGNSSTALGVKWETLSSNTIDYSNSAFNLTNGTSVSSFDQISAAIDDRYSKTSSDERYLQKSLDSTLTGKGTTNKKLGVAWSALSSNKIDSAKSASSAEYITNGTNYSGYNDITGAINNKLNTNAIKTSAIGNTTYVTAINTGSNDIPVKDTNFWAVNTTASTTAGNDNWQHYVTTSNTFNYYQMIVHPSGTTADNSWNNDNIIHIILEE